MPVSYFSPNNFLLLVLFILMLIFGGIVLYRRYFNAQTLQFEDKFYKLNEKLMGFHQELLNSQHTQQHHFDQHLLQSLKFFQESTHAQLVQIKQHLVDTLNQSLSQTDGKMEQLSNRLDARLQQISQQVERRLLEGFEKTNTTFHDILSRLSMIDHAQKKLTELSSNIVNLQEILNDKSARGCFGEVQLSALVNNMFPAQCVAYQHQLSNGKRADCVLFLPEPAGNVVIDAKFPLENYRRSLQAQSGDEMSKRQLENQFRQDIKKHIQDVASKYIIPGETADGAVLFIPAESVFAHIHAHYSDLVDYAHKMRVWLVSPYTLMAVLTTARSVLKDHATRQHVDMIRIHLNYLAKDFDRFQKRMANLEKHIDLAHQDVKDVNISANKITNRFRSIEKAELSEHLPATEEA